MTVEESHDVFGIIFRVFPGAEIKMEKRPCKKCKGAIVLMKDQEGKLRPFDAEPYKAWYLDEADGSARQFKSHKPHWKTCPALDAKQ